MDLRAADEASVPRAGLRDPGLRVLRGDPLGDGQQREPRPHRSIRPNLANRIQRIGQHGLNTDQMPSRDSYGLLFRWQSKCSCTSRLPRWRGGPAQGRVTRTMDTATARMHNADFTRLRRRRHHRGSSRGMDCGPPAVAGSAAAPGTVSESRYEGIVFLTDPRDLATMASRI